MLQRLFVGFDSSTVGTFRTVSVGALSHGGDVAVYVSDIIQPSLPTLFCFIQFLCLFLSLRPFQLYIHSMNSPDNSPLSYSSFPVLFLPHCSFQLYIYQSLPSPDTFLVVD